MRHISIAFVLSTLLLVSICSAQQTSTSDNNNTNSRRDASPIGIEGPVIGGDGTRNFIPIWATPGYLLSSVIYQASGGNVGIGTTSPAAKLDVNGGINTSATYQIGGNNVVNIGSPADQNLFLGVGAGANNVAGSGSYNTFSGYESGLSNTNGSGNTFYGSVAGSSNTTGSLNTFAGNVAGYLNTTGFDNSFFGGGAGQRNTTGYENTFAGVNAGSSNTTGYRNTFYGAEAGIYSTTGIYNIFIGQSAGLWNTIGSNDVYISSQNLGCPYPCTESNTIRIGGASLGGPGPQTAAYIAGIYNSTATPTPPFQAVCVDLNGTLFGTTPGTSCVVSSRRFKEHIADMGDSTSALMKLRPVTFLYKPEYANGDRTQQYGLVAEEVAKVYPELVAYDKDGQPYTVRYQYITTMLLNEVQKQYHRAEAEAKVITAQEQKIDELEQRLSRLESLIPQTVAQK